MPRDRHRLFRIRRGHKPENDRKPRPSTRPRVSRRRFDLVIKWKFGPQCCHLFRSPTGIEKEIYRGDEIARSNAAG